MWRHFEKFIWISIWPNRDFITIVFYSYIFCVLWNITFYGVLFENEINSLIKFGFKLIKWQSSVDFQRLK